MIHSTLDTEFKILLIIKTHKQMRFVYSIQKLNSKKRGSLIGIAIIYLLRCSLTDVASYHIINWVQARTPNTANSWYFTCLTRRPDIIYGVFIETLKASIHHLVNESTFFPLAAIVRPFVFASIFGQRL